MWGIIQLASEQLLISLRSTSSALLKSLMILHLLYWWFYICNQRKMQQPFTLRPAAPPPAHRAVPRCSCRLVTLPSPPDWSPLSTCWSILKMPNFKFVFLQKCLRNLADCGPPGCCERVDVDQKCKWMHLWRLSGSQKQTSQKRI